MVATIWWFLSYPLDTPTGAARVIKRRQPTPKERRQLYDQFQGLCACGCAMALGPRWVAEHVHPLALGGANSVGSNIVPYRLECAALKTNGPPHTSYGSDKHAIAKTARLAAGGRKRKGAPIQSRSFPSKEERRKLRERYERR